MRRPEVTAPVVAVIQIPRLAGGDQTTATGALHTAPSHDRHESRAQRAMRHPIAALLRGTPLTGAMHKWGEEFACGGRLRLPSLKGRA